MKNRTITYDNVPDVLAGVHGLRSPEHITLDASKVTADAEGRKYFEPGFWVAKSGEYGRPLPRTKVATSATTADTALVVENAQAFVPGDNIYVVPASAQINITGTWAATNTLTITVGGLAYTYSADGADTTTIAALAAVGFNSDPSVSQIAQAIASGSTITILSKDYKTPLSISVAAAGGSATAAVADSQSVLIPFRMVGEVDSAGVDVENKTLTLTAPAEVAIAAGVPVGTADLVIGMHLRGLDLNEQALEVGVYTSLSGKAGAFPYWDAGLAAQFPEIQASNQ